MNKALILAAGLLAGACCHAAQAAATTFNAVVHEVMARPQFRHASFGVEVYSLDRNQVLYAYHPDELFRAASTTKLLTEGTALQLLGPDYRFRTPIYRTGEIDANGTLHGDLVWVASGDPNLSNRVRTDGTLAFEDTDHADDGVDARVVPGDPLLVVRELARQIAAAGIRRVTGEVRIDTSLFPQGEKTYDLDQTISPVMVNDNLIDLTLIPGKKIGDPASVTPGFTAAGVCLTYELTTGAPHSDTTIDISRPSAPAQGCERATLHGSIAVDSPPYHTSYAVQRPGAFAASLLRQLLAEEGVKIARPDARQRSDATATKRFYVQKYLVAEHVSPPLSEEVKVTLKVSQNLHAFTMPFILGAVLGKSTDPLPRQGFELERQFLTQAGLDLNGAALADGAGEKGWFSPDFMVHYLAYLAHQPTHSVFENALPILGRDGTLARIQVSSPAAGHVIAKTGTYDDDDLLNERSLLTAKALAGYTTTPSGEHVTFALYLNNAALPPHDPDAAQTIGGQALGEIAGAIYLLPIEVPSQ